MLCAAGAARAERVTIFAAASLKTALDELQSALPEGAAIAYGGSAAMARQIVQGAQADIVILAHPDWMDWAEGQGALASASRCDLLGNELVVAGPALAEDFTPASAEQIIDRLAGGRLAIGNLRSVPAGQYARDWLQGAGWLEALRPHLAQVGNVRLALALVARGEVPLGVIYRSDVVAEPRVRALYTVPSGSHDPIRYPIALTQVARPGAKAVMQQIIEARGIFERAGFMPLMAGEQGACP